MAVYNEKNKAKWTRDGRHWYFAVYYKDLNGIQKKKISKMYRSQPEAEEAEALFITKRDHPNRIKFTIVAKDFFEDYKKKRKLSSYEGYLYAYNKHILPYFEEFYINDINIQNVRFWKEQIEDKHLKINYSNKLYNVLKMIFDFAIKMYNLSSNPVQILGRFENKDDIIINDEEKIRYITLENFNMFISVIDDEKWRAFFTFLFYTGMRKGEVLALSWRDIDFDNKQIIVNKTIYYKHKNTQMTNTKNKQNRKIKMNKLLYDTLLKYKNIVMEYSDYKDDWFVFGNTRFLAPVTIDRAKAKYFGLINDKLKRENKPPIQEITIHEFRHSHVSLLINEYIKNNGTDTTRFFLMMSDRMGHTIEVMKKTYLHLFPTIQDDIVDLLDNL